MLHINAVHRMETKSFVVLLWLTFCGPSMAYAQTLEWTQQLGTSREDYSLGVSADGLGNIFISGSTHGNLGESNAGSSDAFISKYTELPKSEADFDEDGDVDGADFLHWQRGYGITGDATMAQGDANQDRAVDGDDLTIWESQYGTAPASFGNAVVPEHSSIVLLLTLTVLALARFRIRRR